MSEPVHLDFSGIGAAKCGTTWIHRCLAEHPEICASQPKEMRFRKPGGPSVSLAAFAPHFAHCTSERIRGDVSPSHFEDVEVRDLFAEHFPHIKLFVCLRNPIERYLSAYYFHLARGEQKFPTLHEKIEAELGNPEGSFDLMKGRYAEHLSLWLEQFPQEQLKILFYEDTLSDPVRYMQELYRFLGVDDSFIPPSATTAKTHTSVTQRSEVLHRTLSTTRRLFTSGPLQGLAPLGRRLGLGSLKREILKRNVRVEKRETDERSLDPALRSRLAQYYREDVAALEKLTGRELSNWN